MQATKNGAPISFWHNTDLCYDRGAPLQTCGVFNFVTTNPLGSTAKYSVMTGEVDNPIRREKRSDGSLFSYDYDFSFGTSMPPPSTPAPVSTPSPTTAPDTPAPSSVVDTTPSPNTPPPGTYAPAPVATPAPGSGLPMTTAPTPVPATSPPDTPPPAIAEITPAPLQIAEFDGIFFNVGILPQTWTNSLACYDKTTGASKSKGSRNTICGDGKPIELIELSGESLDMGTVTGVRLLGYIVVIEFNIISYKMLAIRSDVTEIMSIDDVDVTSLMRIKDFLLYNNGKFGVTLQDDGKVFSSSEALDLVEILNNHWFKLTIENGFKNSNLNLALLPGAPPKPEVYSYLPNHVKSDDSFQSVDRNGKPVSLWQGVDLCYTKGVSLEDCNVFNFVSEVPLGEKTKYAISKSDEGHPIKTQRTYQSGLKFNYGFLPKTWSNEFECGSHPKTGKKLSKGEEHSSCGDGNPVKVIDFSGEKIEIGSVHKWDFEKYILPSI